MTESERATVAWYERGLEALEVRLADLAEEIEAQPGRLAERLSEDIEDLVERRVASECLGLARENARLAASVERLREFVRELLPAAVDVVIARLEAEGGDGAEPLACVS